MFDIKKKLKVTSFNFVIITMDGLSEWLSEELSL